MIGASAAAWRALQTRRVYRPGHAATAGRRQSVREHRFGRAGLVGCQGGGCAAGEAELQRETADRHDVAVPQIVAAADRLTVDRDLSAEARRDVAETVAGDRQRDARG